MSDKIVQFPYKMDLVDSVNHLIEEGFPKIQAVAIVMGAFTEDNIQDGMLSIPVEDFGVAWLGLYKEFLINGPDDEADVKGDKD